MSIKKAVPVIAPTDLPESIPPALDDYQITQAYANACDMVTLKRKMVCDFMVTSAGRGVLVTEAVLLTFIETLVKFEAILEAHYPYPPKTPIT